MPPENATQPLQAPMRIGKYEVIRKLGDGATSTVYLCRDPFAEREVAVKVIPQSAMKDLGSGALMRRLFMTCKISKSAH